MLAFLLLKITQTTKPTLNGLMKAIRQNQRTHSMVKHSLNDVEAKLNTHEEVCAYRYESINARLKRLEQILLGTAGFIIVFLLTQIFNK